MRAVVTAGGTREPIDDVRVIANLSTGRFGVAVARALHLRGVEVTLLAGPGVDVSGLPQAVRVVPYGSTAELAACLVDATDPAPDLVFMAAAVADYTPVPVQGKLPSDADALVLNLRRNPKLLDTLRPRCPNAVLIGFKLLSGVSTARLVEVASAQNARAGLDLTFANDLATLGGDTHPGLLVGRGDTLPLKGPRDRVAAQLVDAALPARWTRGSEAPPRDDVARAELLQRITEGWAGSFTTRAPPGYWTTSDVGASVRGELVYVVLPRAYWGPAPPGSEVVIHDTLLRALPGLCAVLDPGQALVLDPIDGPDPVAALARAAWDGAWNGGALALRLPDGGHLVGIPDVAAVGEAWTRVRESAAPHLGHPLAPIFDGGEIVGALSRSPEGVAIWVDPRHRGGTGDRVAEALGPTRVLSHPAVTPWWIARGWRVLHRDASGAPSARDVLDPPHARRDLREAASVCLLDPVGRRVLLGQRRVAPWQGWWAFPGGGLEPGETPLDAALRELTEETGLRATAAPLRSTIVHVGTGDPDRVYRVHNVVLPVFEARPPARSEELDARWVDLDEALHVRPMTAGTRRILRALAGLHARDRWGTR